MAGRLALTATAACLFQAAGAAGPVDLSGIDLGDELALLQEEDVVISAARHAQRIEDSPSAVTVFTREDILRSGYRALTDILRLVPGADTFHTRPGQFALGVRANSSLAGDLLLVLIDGRDVVDVALGMTMWSFLPVDVDSIERIEVIRGPGSSIYGANALQGVVNIVTRRPTTEPFAAEVTAAGASAVTWGLDGRVHGTAGPVSWWASGGFDQAAQPEVPAEPDMEAYRVRARVGLELGDEGRASVEVGTSGGDSSLYTALGAGRWQFSLPYARARLSAFRTEVVLNAQLSRLSAAVDPLIQLPGSDGDPFVIARIPPLSNESASGELGVQHHVTLLTLAEGLGATPAGTARTLLERNRLTAGAVGSVLRHRSDTLIECPNPDVPYEEFDVRTCAPIELTELRAGLYLQDEWQPLDTLALTVGARVDLNNLHPALGFSPRAAAVWRPLPDHAFRLAAGSAYRKPTLLETRAHTAAIVADLDPDDGLFLFTEHLLATQLGNPDLTHQRTDSYELGWRGSLVRGVVDANLELFFSRHHDRIRLSTELDAVALTADVGFRNQPGASESVGGEASVTVRPLDGLDVRVAYSLDEDLGDERAGLEPTHRIVASVRARLPAGVRLAVDGFWASPFTDTVQNPSSILAPRLVSELGGWVLVNASVGYRLGLGGDRHVDLTAAVWNLANVQARESPGVDLPDWTSHGGTRLPRRLSLMVRGRY